MPSVSVNGIDLYYEEAGAGPPIIFSHEFAGSLESWEPQLRFFSRRYRVIAYNHRGYPPSTVPDDPAAYSEEQLVADLLGLLDTLQIDRSHIVGLSMGGAVALKFAIGHSDRCRGNGPRTSAPWRNASSITAPRPWQKSTRAARRGCSY